MTARQRGENLVVELPVGPMAGPGARRALLARDEPLPGSVRDDVLLLVTELVTNAVLHSGAGPDTLVRVELRPGKDMVWVSVSDDGTGFAAEPPLERKETDGWGLALVDRIAKRWAIAPTGSGTCAWFEIAYGR